MKLRRVYFAEGEVFYHFSKFESWVEVWTRSKGCGNLVFQFGCSCAKSEIPDLLIANYNANNFIWEE